MAFTAILWPASTLTAVRTFSRSSIVPSGMSTRAITTSSAALRRMAISAAWSMAASRLNRAILALPRLVLPQRRQPSRKRGLHECHVDPVGEDAKTLRAVVLRPRVVGGHEPRRLAMALARGEERIHRLQVPRVRQLARDAEEVGEVEVAEPHDVHARHRRDRIDVVDADRGLDEADHERPLVRGGDLLGHAARQVVVVRRDAERRAAPAVRRIPRIGDDRLRLLSGLDHRDHDPHRAGVEHAGDEVILRRGDPNHRHEADAPAGSELRLHRLDARAAMLHVVEQELGAGGLHDLREARREELERHRAERGLPRGELRFHGVGLHGLSLGWPQRGASSAAWRSAASMLRSSARPVPAMSNAVTWSTEVRRTGSPAVTFTPVSKATAFTGPWPWSWYIATTRSKSPLRAR